MNPEIRRTPRQHEASRGLYEEAVRDKLNFRIATIELDTLIESVRAIILSTRRSAPDLNQAVASLQDLCQTILENVEGKGESSFTDFNRLLMGTNFAVERVIAPLLYSLDANDLEDRRERLADGVSGKSVEIIAGLLDVRSELRMSSLPPDQMRAITGAINENTLMAILNLEETGSMIALPSDTVSDLHRRTDLEYFIYDQNRAEGYRFAISSKTSLQQKFDEQRRHPHDIVISSSDYDNADFSISRLLVKKHDGSPGITDAEELKISSAYDRLLKEIGRQIANKTPDTFTLPADFDRSRLLTVAA